MALRCSTRWSVGGHTRKRTPLGPCRRPMPLGILGGEGFLRARCPCEPCILARTVRDAWNRPAESERAREGDSGGVRESTALSAQAAESRERESAHRQLGVRPWYVLSSLYPIPCETAGYGLSIRSQLSLQLYYLEPPWGQNMVTQPPKGAPKRFPGHRVSARGARSTLRPTASRRWCWCRTMPRHAPCPSSAAGRRCGCPRRRWRGAA